MKATWVVRGIVSIVAVVAVAVGAGFVDTAVLTAVPSAELVLRGALVASVVLASIGAVSGGLTARRTRGGFLERPLKLVAAGLAFLLLRDVWSLTNDVAPTVPAPPHVVVQVIVLAVIGVWAMGFVELDQSV